MNIAIVIDDVLPVRLYGGTQRVSYYLGKALSGLGHHVTFLCRAGSVAPFATVQVVDPLRPLAAQLPADADIVHFNNSVPDGMADRPHVVTIHGNYLENTPPHQMAVFVSRNHAERHGSTHYVYNGLDWDDYPAPLLGLERSYYHFLAKAAWRVKNVKGAIRIVRRLPGAHLHVLGGTRLNLKMGFRFTASPRVHFHGMVDDQGKCRYISRSRGLVFPVLWDEPFGLCLIESLYYGAPVFGTRRGSLPEIVGPEVGFLSDSEDALALHLASGASYSPSLCHQYAADLFSATAMARAYLKVYEDVLGGQRW